MLRFSALPNRWINVTAPVLAVARVHRACLADAPDDSALNDLLGHSITYHIAVGPQAVRKAVTLQTVPARDPDSDNNSQLARTAGFSEACRRCREGSPAAQT